MMAIARRGTPTTAARTTGGTSLAFNVPTSVVDGDVMYAWLVFGDAVTGVTLTGWALLDSDTATSLKAFLYRRVAASEPTSYTVTWTTTAKPVFACAAYTGADTTTPEDQHQVTHETVTQTTHATPSLTPSTATTWAVAFYGDRSTSSGAKNADWTSDAALAEIADANNNTAASSPWMSVCVDDSNGAVTQAAHSYTATSQISIANAAMGLVLLNPAAGATGKSDSDTATGADSAAVAATGTASDAASVTDTATLTAAATAADTATATDSASVTATGTSADTASATDTASLTAATSAADISIATDSATLTAAASAADTAAGVDNATVTGAISTSDTATGAEAASLGADLAAADTATGTEDASTAVTLTAADTATATDTATLLAAATATDTGTAADASTLVAATTAEDAATATETAHIGVLDDDPAYAADTASLTATLTAADLAQAVETAIREIIGGGTDITVTAGPPRRGWSTSAATRGWSAGDPHL